VTQGEGHSNRVGVPSVGPPFIAARHGDEFALVLPETGSTAASLAGRRIYDLLAKDTEKPPLSVRIGVAGYPQDADTVGLLLYAADRALYAPKARKLGPEFPESRE